MAERRANEINDCDRTDLWHLDDQFNRLFFQQAFCPEDDADTEDDAEAKEVDDG
jgi:hypothetical protein